MSTRAERALAARCMNKEGILCSTVYVGAPGFADESGEVLDEDGNLTPKRQRFLSEEQF